MFDVKGSIVALITPFHEDGSVNFEKLKELCEWHIQNATDALLILGTTGESSTMTHEEDDAVVKCVLSCVQGRVPVIVGSGSNCTQTMIEKSVKYANMGADALLVISPYYNKTNTQGMIQHFTAVADAVNKPLILYNVPGRTGCSISEEAIRILSKHPNIVGIKEASGNISYAANIARYLSDDFVMYSGNDDMIVPMLSLGASGVISVLANVVPKQTHDMVMDYLQGNTKKACAAQLYYLDLIHALFCEVNPIPVKEALNIMGKEVGGYRLPLYEMSDEHKTLLKQCMQEVGL
ncbi:4-hydroxy-tetrahydrodipicolinate synthase [Amedibacillus dolichus]|uniref:4-hydroxy-tetrahydrodipicolinate synthase n=2 Tax=Amedibacillus dolichus TaxID=31971 RepID=A0A415PN15_9FIRM|nr:4-hydroxy-tetrahydrodipicolinate synthase [Amedibacillus dolichus]RHM14123.1 4-hydroxy-tetrahydrodipicolinate synthase [Amedibacillus dolichus]CDE23805.1 dihydrodipicolinate synthase 2 [Amedibacillus dolichus CAG:375]